MQIKNARLFPTALAFGRTAEGAPFLSVIIKGTFRLQVSRGPAQAAAVQLPIRATDEPYDPEQPGGLLEFESDLVPFKPRTDVVLVGHAYSPQGRPTKVLDVAIEVGPLHKKLRVFGDRAWSYPSDQGDASPYLVGPVDFVKMPLTWDRAFGGIDKTAGIVGNRKPWCERNYLGRGFCAARTVASIDNTRLPNIEDPDDPIRSWESQPRPVGCGFFPRNSRPRSDWLGTFDQKWKAERAPLMPTDFRFDAYNGADLTMQVEPYLLGNELLRLTNVTAAHPSVECYLPGIAPRLSFVQGSLTRPAQARLDTLLIMPDAATFCVVWRTAFAIEREDASDVSAVRIEYEKLPSISTGNGYS